MADKKQLKFNTGKDGVAQIYKTAKGGTEVYMGNTGEFDEDTFNVSYGKGSHIDYDQKKQGKLHYFTTKGSPINYHSGSKSGRSTRIDTYPGGGMWDNDTDYYYKDNPGYLYNKKGIKNGEYTTYIRVHKDLGTHQAYAHKIGGRDEDALRSLFEMVYPTSDKDQVSANYNYAHFPYVHAKAKQFRDLDQFGEDSGWLALKTIHIVKDDYTHWEMWADFDPIDDDGSINNNWEKIAEFKDEGCDEYDNINVTWKCHKDVCRVDGFGEVDFALFSDREIDPAGKLNLYKTPNKKDDSGDDDDDNPDDYDKIQEPPIPKYEQQKPVIDNSQSGISTEEIQAAQKWLQDALKLNSKLVDTIQKVSAQQQGSTRPPSAAEQTQSQVVQPDPQVKADPES